MDTEYLTVDPEVIHEQNKYMNRVIACEWVHFFFFYYEVNEQISCAVDIIPLCFSNLQHTKGIVG